MKENNQTARWETIPKRQLARSLKTVRIPDAEQYRFTSYTDKTTGDVIIRIVPVPAGSRRG